MPMGVSPRGVNLSGVPRGSRPLAGYKGSPHENLSFSRAASGGRKRYLGTPQTPAGKDPCTRLGKGVALKLMPLGVSPRGVNLSGFQGAVAPWAGYKGSPHENLSFSHAASGGRKRYLATPQTPAGKDPCTRLG